MQSHQTPTLTEKYRRNLLSAATKANSKKYTLKIIEEHFPLESPENFWQLLNCILAMPDQDGSEMLSAIFENHPLFLKHINVKEINPGKSCIAEIPLCAFLKQGKISCALFILKNGGDYEYIYEKEHNTIFHILLFTCKSLDLI